MSLFIRRLFWFILVVASGLVAALLGASQFGISVDLNALAEISGLHEISGITGIINKIPGLLNFPLIKSYGFYGSLAIFLIFLLIFKISLRSGRNKETETVYSRSNKVVAETNTEAEAVVDADSAPDSFGETFAEKNITTEIITETNSDAIVGTDGKIYDGTATFSDMDTYSNMESESDINADADSYDKGDDDDEAEILAQASISGADDCETGLSHLTDTELKSKTLDFADEMRSFEADYQNSHDATATELSEFASKDGLKDDLENFKDTYEQRQTAFSSEFKSKYRPEAAAVRHEISKRLGFSEPYDEFSPALDHGMLVGANPVTEAADIIEELVRKLA